MDPGLAELDSLLDEPGGEGRWYQAARALLEEAYLAGDNPRAQSGTSATPDEWERRRRPIVEAVNRDGSFLDIGCASGLLMESMHEWAAERGFVLEPYGLDYSERLAALARSRLPQWAHRISVGNAANWDPPRRFDFVRTELVYVPPARQRGLVNRLVEQVVAPGGRLIVCSYGSHRKPAPRANPPGALLTEWGYRVVGESEAAEVNGVVVTCCAWVERGLGISSF